MKILNKIRELFFHYTEPDKIARQRRDTLFTLEDVVNDIVDHRLPEESRNMILKMDGPEDMGVFHFNAGMGLRNDLGLWHKQSILHQHFLTRFGIAHADDMSGLIFDAVWCKVHEIPFDPKPIIQKYRKHWKKQGLNLDQTEIK